MTQYPQGGWPQQGQAPQQQVPEQVVSAENFFDNVGGRGAPSFKFNGEGDGVRGTIVDQYSTVVKNLAGEVIYYPQRPGEPRRPIPQLNVTLQTNLRNWDKVKNVPRAKNPDGTDGPELPASEDDGTRRVYIKYQMTQAVGAAFKAGGGQPGQGLQNGAELAIKLVGHRPPKRPGDNPMPLYEARYTPPSGSADFMGHAEQQQAQSTPAAQGDPWATQQQAQSTPAAQGDPWATQGHSQPQNDDPPF